MAELLLGWPLERSVPEIGFRPPPVLRSDVSRPLREISQEVVVLTESLAAPLIEATRQRYEQKIAEKQNRL